MILVLMEVASFLMLYALGVIVRGYCLGHIVRSSGAKNGCMSFNFLSTGTSIPFLSRCGCRVCDGYWIGLVLLRRTPILFCGVLFGQLRIQSWQSTPLSCRVAENM